MTNDLDLGPDAEANRSIAVLKGERPQGALVSQKPVTPGVWWTFERDAATRGELLGSDDAIMSARFDVSSEAELVSLQIRLGPIDFTDRRLIGFVCRSRAPQAVAARPCVRSIVEEGVVDRFFSKHMVSYSQESAHLDLIEIGPDDERLPLARTRRRLIFFFPAESFRFDLIDLRLFVV